MFDNLSTLLIGGGKMPQIFKALASILVWILWISGLVMGFSTLIIGTIAGDLFNPAQPTPMAYPALFAVALAYGVGAVVVMILRQKME
jgi:hypothetical protein